MNSKLENRPVLGLILRFSAVVILSTMFMLIKLIGESGVHVFEIVFYRYLIGALMIGGWLYFKFGLSSFKTKRMKMHLLRTIVGLIAMCCNFGAVMILPLAEASVLMFTVPIIATMLSIFLLSEPVGLKRGSAVIVGFFGILIALQPGESSLPLTGVVLGLTGATAGAYVMVLIRQLSTTESSATMVFYYTVLAVPIMFIAMLFYMSAHSLETYGLILITAIIGTIGMFVLTESVRYAPISKLMPIDYFSIFFATAYGFFIWGNLPGKMFWPGAALIILSGVIIAIRGEQKRRALKR